MKKLSKTNKVYKIPLNRPFNHETVKLLKEENSIKLISTVLSH